MSISSTEPSAVASASTAGLVRMDVKLHGAGRADDQERVAVLTELGLDPLGVDLPALDEEARAVPVARQLAVNRLGRKRASGRERGLGQRLSAKRRGNPARSRRAPRRPRPQLLPRGGSGAAPASAPGPPPRLGARRGWRLRQPGRPRPRPLGERPRHGPSRPLLRFSHRVVRRVHSPRNAVARRRRRAPPASSASAAPPRSREDHARTRALPVGAARTRFEPPRRRASPAPSGASRIARTVRSCWCPCPRREPGRRSGRRSDRG